MFEFEESTIEKKLQKLKSSLLLVIKQKLFIHRNSLITIFLGVYLPLKVVEWLAVQISTPDIVAGFGVNLLSLDQTVLLAIHATEQTSLDKFAAIFTQFGIYWGVAPAAVIISLILLWRQQWQFLAYLLTTLIGTTLINTTAKVLFHRERPHLWEGFYHRSLDYSFPSGHAMSSMAFIMVLLVLTGGSRHWGWILGFGSLFVIGIGWTRLYLGVHYPSDILAGWMMAIAWSLAVKLLIFQPVNR